MEKHRRIGTPIVHDFHHHEFNTGGLSNADALALAVSTWGDITPVTHYSQSGLLSTTTSVWDLTGPVDTYGHNVDVMLECKHKSWVYSRCANFYQSGHKGPLQIQHNQIDYLHQPQQRRQHVRKQTKPQSTFLKKGLLTIKPCTMNT